MSDIICVPLTVSRTGRRGGKEAATERRGRKTEKGGDKKRSREEMAGG